MSKEEKRYRFQIQFDMFAETDEDCMEEVLKLLSEMKDCINPNIIWMAENYFASFENREIEHIDLKNKVFDKHKYIIDKIKSELPF